MRYLLTILLLCASYVYPLNLGEKFLEADEGTYIVSQQNQLVTLLHLHTKKEHKLLFEEVSIPLHQSKKIVWSQWLEKGAPGHTSWILYEVDLQKNKVTECYSLTRKSWVPTEEMEAFLLPLISLDLTFLSEEARLQTGPTMRPGVVESRPWGPPQVFEGKKIASPEYAVYTAKWPQDHTDLSGKPIVLYFDPTRPTFPFPFWLQVRDGALKFKMRAIDSGTGLVSLTTDIPRREPTFLSAPHKEEASLTMTLDLPDYYETLQLYAIDMSKEIRSTHVVPHTLSRTRSTATLTISQAALDTLFTPGHEYLWIIASEDPKMALESPHLYTH